jgi:23S rRNA (cytosine1962-C5)-methyltransferase
MNQTTPSIFIKKGRSKPLWYGNPWVFPNSIEQETPKINDGDIVSVYDQNKQFIAYGFYNHRSFYRIRLLSYQADEFPDDTFFRKKLQECFLLRKNLFKPLYHDAFRLVNSEGDHLPGLTLDLFGSYAVIKFGSKGYLNFLDCLLQIIQELTKAIFGVTLKGIYLSITPEEREKEGINLQEGFLFGEKCEKTEIYQDGLKFQTHFGTMQKTGFYLDQRENRLFLKNFFSGQKFTKALDAYSYTSAFALYLADSFTTIQCVDSSEIALKEANFNITLNHKDNITVIKNDVLKHLAMEKDYDLILLDPPKFMSKKHQSEQALRQYIKINQAALQSIAPGGFLATFSCSGNLTQAEFSSLLLEAAYASGRKIKLLHETLNSQDHPYHPAIPETGYLKFILSQVF